METKTLLLTATYLVGIGELILAIFFWVTHSKSEIRKVVALLALSTSLWVLLSAATSYKPDIGHAAMANNFVFVFGILLLTALIHLVLIFPYPFLRLDAIHKWMMYVPVFIFSSLSIFTDALQLGATGGPNDPGKIIQGPAYPIYNLYLLILYILTIIVLFKKNPRLDGMHKKNNTILIYGVLLGGLPAVYVDLLAPLFFAHLEFNYLIGVLFTGFWLSATTYIVVKK